jgi:hypothetical protein
MCVIDWPALGTWALVVVTGALVMITYFLSKKQINILSKQIIEQINTSREQMKVQTDIAREQMKIKIQLNLLDKFDNILMKSARSKLAKQIIAEAEHDEIQEDVIDFFEDVGTFFRRGYLDKELVWADFSFYAIRWWSILKDYIFVERKRNNNDQTIFEDFETLINILYEIELSRRKLSRSHLEPSSDDIKQFLKDESNLV